jgi:hypothetical protein
MALSLLSTLLLEIGISPLILVSTIVATLFVAIVIPVGGDHRTGACETCLQTFTYWLDNCQLTNSTYAYCESCGTTAILSLTDPRMPKLPGCQAPEQICAALEPYLLRCYCGGQFKRGASPRCPLCNAGLSANWAGSYIERNAFGTPSGWRWQANWTGPYAFVAESKLVNNDFRDSPASQ